MATKYVLVAGTATERESRLFQEVLDVLPWESYPNGHSGWQDGLDYIFENLGFCYESGRTGDAYAIGVSKFRGSL